MLSTPVSTYYSFPPVGDICPSMGALRPWHGVGTVSCRGLLSVDLMGLLLVLPRWCGLLLEPAVVARHCSLLTSAVTIERISPVLSVG